MKVNRGQKIVADGILPHGGKNSQQNRDELADDHRRDGQHQSIFQRRPDDVENRLAILARIAGIELEQLPEPFPILNVNRIVETVELAQPLVVFGRRCGNVLEASDKADRPASNRAAKKSARK